MHAMIPLLQQQEQRQYEHPTSMISSTGVSSGIVTIHEAKKSNTALEKQQQVHRHQWYQNCGDNGHFCDPYHILHIRRDATKYEMKRSYQQLALLYHPSLTTVTMLTYRSNANLLKEQHKKERLLLFTLIAASYETLSVKETRLRMDMILLQQQQLKNKKNQAQPQHTSTMTSIKSEKHNIRSPKTSNQNERNNNSNKNIIISKTEYKIRKKLREERRMLQQQRRDDMNNNKKKRHVKHDHMNVHNVTKKELQKTSLLMKQHPTPPELALSPSSSTDNLHHSRRCRRHHADHSINDSNSGDDSVYNGGASSGTDHSTSRQNTTMKYMKNEFQKIPPKPRRNQKRGYNWAYVSSPCPNDDTTENEIHGVNDKIPYDEPFDRIDDYYAGKTSFATTSTVPVVAVVHNCSNSNPNNNYAQPPSLVESSDSEMIDDADEDDNDSDYLLSLQSITKDFYQMKPPPKSNTINATERWFGGPLKLMYRARKFQPFTDPLVLFERTFRSGLIVPERQVAANTAKDGSSKIAGLIPCTSLISPSTLATFSRNGNVVPISAADDIVETLPDGTIITRTHRTIPVTTISSDPNQQETTYRTVTRTITKYPPPDQLHNQLRRMSVAVTTDVVVKVESKTNLSSTSSFGHHMNHCVDCMGWITCQSFENNDTIVIKSNINDDGGKNSFMSLFQSWLPSC
jgi:curved DNA-binding protein CbpA